MSQPRKTPARIRIRKTLSLFSFADPVPGSFQKLNL